MPLTVDRILTVNFRDLLNEQRRVNNQWTESALLRELERHGQVEQLNFRDPIIEQLVYTRQAVLAPVEPEPSIEDDGSQEILDA